MENNSKIMPKFLLKFLAMESSSGIIMILASIVAIILSNSSIALEYKSLLGTQIGLIFNDFNFQMPLYKWIKEFLMAIFFLLVSLEIKREMIEGALSKKGDVILPLVCAIGGMVIPALIYLTLNYAAPQNYSGWAVPTATDIAFALCMLNLVKGVPASLKVFLLALAIIDDLGAVIIIAFAYSNNISMLWLLVTAALCAVLFLFNRIKIESLIPYLIIGLIMWAAVFNSGISATTAGVLTGIFIPFKLDKHQGSPLKKLMHYLHPLVSYFILPVFAFSAAGVNFSEIKLSYLLEPLPVGITMGLFLGKQLGVFGAAYMLIKTGKANMPEGANWLQLYGTSILTGIGFTMSLFVSLLAFDDIILQEEAKIGILLGSLLSSVVGIFLLKIARDKNV